MQNFRALGAPPPHPRAFGGWGLRPQTPKSAPPIANFWLRACPRPQPMIRLSCTTLLNGQHFSQIFGLSPFPLAKSQLSAKIGHGF